MENKNKLEEKIGYTFKDERYIIRALTHKSYSNENKNELNNERFEFLGDAILQFVSTQNLFVLFPEESEGVLSVYRSALVKTEYLASVATKLDLENYIRISEGQRREFDRNHKSSSILADTIEAIIGAIYLDGGLEVSKDFINQNILLNAKDYLTTITARDPKTIYQEYTQKKKNVTPGYKIHKEDGLAHEKIFTVGLYLKDELINEGVGKSKQEAEKAAAELALKYIPVEDLEVDI